MLFRRVITALILIPLVVAGVLYLSTPALGLVLAVGVLIGGFEWTGLAGLSHPSEKLLFLLGLAGVMTGLAQLLHTLPASALPVAAAVSLWWGLVAVRLARYTPASPATGGKLVKSVFGLVVLAPAWVSLLAVHGFFTDGPLLVLYVLVLIWTADSCAYFAGRQLGRVKLAPAISPGKTREGVYGALAGAVLCGILLYSVRPETGPLPLVVLFSILIALGSVVGDLFESLLKRQAGVKDSGALLPGHGGMLDRIDSLTAALPLYLCGLLLLEKVN